MSQVVKQLGQLAITDKPASTTSATNLNDPAQSTDVNMVQTTKSSRRKNWNQRRKNSLGEQEEANTKETQPGNNSKKGKKKLKFPCLACKEDHFTKDCPCLTDVQKFMEQSKNPTPDVLTNPFPTQHQQMVAQVPAQQPVTQSMTAPSGTGSSSIHIMMVDVIDLATQAKNYEKQLEGEASTHVDSPSLPQSNGPLTFEKTNFKAPLHPSKGTLRHTHNLNVRATQYYSFVEDLAQAPCAMSALEVLQSFPSQRKALL
jgi:ribosomal protein L44E